MVDEDFRVREDLPWLDPVLFPSDFDRRSFASCFAIGHLAIRRHVPPRVTPRPHPKNAFICSAERRIGDRRGGVQGAREDPEFR